MQIEYKNHELQKVCTDAHEAIKKYRNLMADKIHERIDQITAADTVELLEQFHIGKCHHLEGNRKHQYAMDLVQPYRLIFIKKNLKIYTVQIVEIVNYH